MSPFLRFILRSGRNAPFLSSCLSYSRSFKHLRQNYFNPGSRQNLITMPPKRKRSSVATTPSTALPPSLLIETPILPPGENSSIKPPPPKRRASRRSQVDTNPDHNPDIVDDKAALRASPDADEQGESFDIEKLAQNVPFTPAKTNSKKVLVKDEKDEDSDSPLSELESQTHKTTPAKKKSPTKSSIAAKKGSDEIKAFIAEQAVKKAAAQQKIKKENGADEWENRLDPDGDETGPVEDADNIKLEAARPPPVNSEYLPLPWKGRLGYVSVTVGWKWMLVLIS